MKNYLILILLFSVLGACQNNKMKTDEKKLVSKILSEEEKLALEEKDRMEQEKLLADSLANLPEGFRFKENRSIDRNNPPLTIDIANNLDSIRDISLSDVAQDIEYIRMQAIPDSTIPKDLKLRYYFMDNYIVASNLYGIHLYSKKGEYIQLVVKNELTGIKLDVEKNRISIFCSSYSHKGGRNNVWARGDHLFYNYRNSQTGQNLIMDFDCSTQHISGDTQFDPEHPNAITGLGKVSMDVNNGINKPEKPLYPNGMIMASIDYFDKEFDVFNPDINTYITKLDDDKMLGILSSKGDTLASFRKFEQVKNYTKKQMRGTDHGIQYEKGGDFFLRTDFNDTIFQVIPPNYLRPVYVLNLGQYKLSKQAGVDPDVSLKGKVIPMSWADAKDYIFMTFSRDSYDCPRNRREKKVKIYQALYSKKDRKFQIVKADPTNYFLDILTNDIDGGVAVWPQAYMINKSGEIMVSLKGKDLKDHVQSSEFKNSKAVLSKKESLAQFANRCSGQDDILMVVK